MVTFLDEPSFRPSRWLAVWRMVADLDDLKKSMTSVIIGTPTMSSTNDLPLFRSAIHVCQCARYLGNGR